MLKLKFDIETIRNADMISNLPEPDVKYGNLKDEEKRKIKYDEACEEQVKKMALSPLYGRVACAIIGQSWFYLREETDQAERELINEILTAMAPRKEESSCIISWNGNGFDFPFVFKRALILGVPSPFPMSHYTKRYSSFPHADLMQIWCGWFGFAKLDDVAGAILGQKKIEFDIHEIPELLKTPEGLDKLQAYNTRDGGLCLDLFDKFDGLLIE